MNRRQVLLSLTALALSPTAARAARRIKAVAFDGFVIWDPSPMNATAEELAPGQGPALIQAWRLRQFQYSWMRNAMGRYADFRQVSDEALDFAAEALKLSLTATARARLVDGLEAMPAHADALIALKALKAAGIKMALCSNLTPKMMTGSVASAGYDGLFDHLLSTDQVGVYKPDPRAYQMAVDAFGLSKDNIAFAAFGGWDAAGAKTFGYPTYWTNRTGQPVERLGVAPDRISANAADLPSFVQSI